MMILNFILHFKFSPVTCLEKKTSLSLFFRNVYKGPNNVPPSLLPAIIPNKGAGAGALAAINQTMPHGPNLPQIHHSPNGHASNPLGHTSNGLSPLKGEINSTADKVKAQGCVPQKGVQKGPLTFASKEEKLIEEAKKYGLTKYDNGTTKYASADSGVATLTKKGIELFTNEIHKPDLVDKSSPLAKGLIGLPRQTNMPIAGMLRADPSNVLTVPSQTHLVVVFSEKDNHYLAIGSLTSAKYNNVFLAPFQINNQDKNQFLQFFKFPRIVQKDDFVVDQPATEYVQKKNIVDIISVNTTKILAKCSSLEKYNSTMVTLEALEQMVFIARDKNEIDLT